MMPTSNTIYKLDTSNVHASVQEPLVIGSELKQAQGQGRNVDYEKCIYEKRGLIEKAKLTLKVQIVECGGYFL